MNALEFRDYIEVVTYTIALIAVIIINSFLYLRAKKIRLVQYFFRVQILLGLWMLAKIFKPIAQTPNDMWLWVLVEYFGICYLSVELFAFAYIYKYNKSLPKYIYHPLMGITTVNYIMLFTNVYHHLFYTEVLLIHSIKGPYFYVHMMYSYGLFALGIYLLITSKANKTFAFKDKVIFVIGLVLPLLVNVVYVFHLINIPFDLTPITFNAMILSFGYAAFRNNYYDMQMMTRYKIIENLYEGVVILDKDNRIIEFNKKMSELVLPVASLKKYTKFEDVFALFEPFLIDYDRIVEIYNGFIYSAMTHSNEEIEVLINNVCSYYIFSMQKTYSIQGEYSGSIIKFVDITEYHKLLFELEAKNTELQRINNTLNENISVKKRLVVEQERNRVSKEVHDILGHSVTIVISLLEMIKQTYDKEPDFAKEKIVQAMDITRKGLKELKLSLTKKKDTSIDTVTLIEDLEKLTDEFKISGVDVEFITNHYLIKIRPNYYDTIFRICQESMTNALRHGKAKKITIAVRFSEHSVDIIIADNGIGCGEVVKGNGIRGMEQRVMELDGFFSCGSPDGEGFNLHVTIPITRHHSNINEVEC